MDKTHSEAYQQLYEEYVDSWRAPARVAHLPWPTRSVRAYVSPVTSPARVARLLDASISELKLDRRIRADAKYILLVNFHQMILLPLGVARPGKMPLSGAALKSDMKTILKKAAATKEEQMSAHSVLEAVTKTWKRLRSSRVKLWG